MNYQTIYDTLMARAKGRVLTVPTERHHILPKHEGGKDRNNIVRLTVKEHFVAHCCLAKLNPRDIKHATALMFMAGAQAKKYGRVYRWAKSHYNTVRLTPENAAAASAALSKALKGVKHSPEHIKARAAAVTGKKRTPEQCKRIGDAQRGRAWSPEKREAIMKGRAAKKEVARIA